MLTGCVGKAMSPPEGAQLLLERGVCSEAEARFFCDWWRLHKARAPCDVSALFRDWSMTAMSKKGQMAKMQKGRTEEDVAIGNVSKSRQGSCRAMQRSRSNVVKGGSKMESRVAKNHLATLLTSVESFSDMSSTAVATILAVAAILFAISCFPILRWLRDCETAPRFQRT